MYEPASEFEEVAARLLEESEPELTPEVLTKARAVLSAPASALSTAALKVLQDVVIFVDSQVDMNNPAAVGVSVGNLTQLLRRTDIDELRRARVLRLLSINFTSLDRPDAALGAAEELVGIARSVAERDPDQLAMLAASLTELARLAQVYGRRSEAAAHGFEAVSMWRVLSSEDHAHCPALAAALNNLAVVLGDGGRLDEAVGLVEEAVAIYNEQAAEDPGFVVQLAESLRNLATSLNENGEQHRALGPAREALRVLRSVSTDEPGIRRGIADTLSSLSAFLAETGDLSEGLGAAEEAVHLSRGLVLESREHLPALAGALTNVANRLSGVGRPFEAVAAAEEAVGIYRDLASRNPALEPDVAMALSNLGSLLHDIGRYGDALARLQESLKIRRALVKAYPSYRSDLAYSLLNVANLLSDGGRFSEAAELAKEAVEIRRGEVRANPRQAGGLGNALDAMAVFAMEANDEDAAMAAADEAVSVLRDSASGNRAFLPDLAKALNNYGAIARTTPGALHCVEEAVAIHRNLADENEAFMSDLASSLDNLASILAEADRDQEALGPAVESVQIRRRLAQANRALVPDLSGALHNLANRMEDLGKVRSALEVSVEILELEGRTDATAAAVHRLLEVEPSDRPDGADAILPAAIDRLGDIIPLALWTVDDPGDRRALLSALAWMASAGTVYLAQERADPRHALEWVDRTITLDLRTGAAMRAPEFIALAERRPDLAARLRRSLGAATPQDEATDELIGDVIREIRESDSGFERFLLPRTAEEITAGLRTTTVVLAGGPRGGVILVVTPGDQIVSVPIDVSFNDVAELATMSLSSRPVGVKVSHERLRSLVLKRVLPALQSLISKEETVLVVPVGVMNWLPLQAVGTLAGLALGLSPTLVSLARERQWPGGPLIVHSHGGGRKLEAGLDESKQVAAMIGVESLTDPVDMAEVRERLKLSPFVHFACHGISDVTDPDASRLELGPSEADWLTVRLLAECMIAQGAPSFVALSACQTGRTELAIPEQASSIANVFIGHGAHCVLSTLWNVNDVVARDFGVEFVHRWMTGASAGEAYVSTLRALASRLAGDPDASQTLDAFQLIGERDLPWPVASSVANPQTVTA
jgi:tetratricopeptide (TPR) repeat protein